MCEFWVVPSRLSSERGSLIFLFVLSLKALPAYPSPWYTEINTSALYFSVPRWLTYLALQCHPLSRTWLSSSFAGSHCLWMQRKRPASPSLPAAASWFPVPAVRAALFSHSATAQGWAPPGTCLCWCLPSRSSALNYASLHSTVSSWFMPKLLDYSSLCLAMEVLLLVGDCEPCAYDARASRLPASFPQERSGQKSAQHPSDVLFRGLQAI